MSRTLTLTLTLALCSVVACDGSGGDGSRVDAILALDGDPAVGEQVYSGECAGCHGVNGEGGTGPSMASAASEGDAEIVEVVLEGEGDMPSFADLPDQDVADLVAYILDTW